MLEVVGISKRYGSFTALQNLSFSVNSGEILGLIGENGAGKSTTLKIISGLIEPDSGYVRYFGREMSDEVKKIIGYLPETDALYENMTASEYLQLFADLYGVKRADGKIDRLLKKFNLPDKPVGEFSKGMKRKLSIARTLIHDPRILIYDEPTGGLDPSTSLMIADTMRELAAGGKIIVFSAHNMYYVERIADTVIIMKEGKALYYGDLDSLLGSSVKYRVTYTLSKERKTVEVDDADELGRVVAEIVEAGGKIVEIDKDVPRLENVYFSLIAGKQSQTFSSG